MVSAKPFDSLMSELELKDRMNHSCEEERQKIIKMADKWKKEIT